MNHLASVVNISTSPREKFVRHFSTQVPTLSDKQWRAPFLVPLADLNRSWQPHGRELLDRVRTESPRFIFERWSSLRWLCTARSATRTTSTGGTIAMKCCRLEQYRQS